MVSSRSAAAAESMIELGRLAPGIGMMQGRLGELPREGDLLRAHAVRLGDHCEGAVLVAELLGRREAAERTPRQEGSPSSSQTSISGRLLRNAGENWFCTLTSASPSTYLPSRICSGSALLSPTISTLPESAISFRVPITSA